MHHHKVLVITYYWPPSGGSGVQRWMYFCKYLPENGILPFVVTVNPEKASYKVADESLAHHVEHIPVFYTSTFEPLKAYSRLTTGNSNEGIPQGFAGEGKPGLFKRMARYVRGNWFIPDARKGWNRHALKKAREIIQKENIKIIITTGPPHSTHLVGLALKRELGITWLADFRDPWTEVYYNRFLYRTKKSEAKDLALEKSVLENSDFVITVGPSLAQLLSAKIPDSKSKVSYILNGFDDEAMRHTQGIAPTDKFIISHIGVLGDSQPISSFLEGLAKLKQNLVVDTSLIEFHITGYVSTSVLDEIKRITPWLKVIVKEYVPHADAIKQMKSSHLLLNSQPEIGDSTYMISGKLMEYIATGNPVMVLGNPQGDAADILKKYVHCAVYSRSDKEGIKSHMEVVYTLWKQKSDSTHSTSDLLFSRRNNTKMLADVLRKIGDTQ